MKILPLSDVHLDFYLLNTNKRKLKRFCESVLHINHEKIDVITVAGDLGHYNADNKRFLTYLSETYNAQVLFTYGNHDLYLVSPKQVSKYKGQSIDRLKEMELWASTQENIHFLDGTFVDIQGVRFGGMCNWYDGTFSPLSTVFTNYEWLKKFNDSQHIYKNGEKYSSFLAISDDLDVEDKRQALIDADCDYLFFHVSPILDKDLIETRYQEDLFTAFYFSNNPEFLYTSKLKYLQFGHTHNALNKHYDHIEVFNASLGYPSESFNFTPRYITLS